MHYTEEWGSMLMKLYLYKRTTPSRFQFYMKLKIYHFIKEKIVKLIIQRYSMNQFLERGQM